LPNGPWLYFPRHELPANLECLTTSGGAEMAESQKKQRVVIVGAGFAGFNAARELSRLVGASTEIVVINSADYFLYLPLMPQVTGGLVDST
jgi:threonine dehydrogenase-like Zn-dependent dehydrogenase